MKKNYLLFLLPIIIFSQTVGLITIDTMQVADGYILFSPLQNTTTYLIDNSGNEINTWYSDYPPGNATYLIPNGQLLRTANPNDISSRFHGTGGKGGLIQLFDWESNLIWDYDCSSDNYCQHHDCEYIEATGSILYISWHRLTEMESEAAGRVLSMIPDGGIWLESIVEVLPTGINSCDTVWMWRVLDHIIQDIDSSLPNYGNIFDNPGKIDINQNRPSPNNDWLHFNGVDYNPNLDQIVISNHNLNEIYIIDHSTVNYDDPDAGIAEAASDAGDILYRWGNPVIYDRGIGADRMLFAQHDARWVEEGFPGEGNITIYNNGVNTGPVMRPYSTIDEICPPLDSLTGLYFLETSMPYAPETLTWRYIATPPIEFFSNNISGAQRLFNGNTIICEGANGRLFEVTSSGEIVWEYINPVNNIGPQYQGIAIERNNVFKCQKYEEAYEAFESRDMTPSGPIELYASILSEIPYHRKNSKMAISPNPFNESVEITISSNEDHLIEIYTIDGKVIDKFIINKPFVWQPARDLSDGVYLINCNLGNERIIRRVIHLD